MPRRPKTAVVAANPTTSPKSKPTKAKTPKIETSVVEQLGVTMWRIRPEKPKDTGARLLTQGGGDKLVAEGVSLDTVFRPKDKV